MLIALAVLGVLCLIGVGSLAVFLVGYGAGFGAGYAAIPEPIALPAPEPVEEPEYQAFALDADPDFYYAEDAYRYAILGPNLTRGQMPELPA